MKRAQYFKIWRDGNQAIEIGNYIDIEQKINYIHKSPVKAIIALNAEGCVFSSAFDYAGGNGLVKIEKVI